MIRKRGHNRALALLLCVVVLVPARPALAYLKLGVTVGGRDVSLKWGRTPARYFVTERGVPGVNPAEFQAAVSRAFAIWAGVPTAAIRYEFAGYTAALPLEEDGMSTLGFLERPELTGVLASTHFLVDSATGELLESDIFFNAAYPWSVAAGGESGRYDLESVALHEIGHFSGLSHSALGETEVRADGSRRVIAAETVMFPIAFPSGNISDRTLRADDIAGISDLYPGAGFNEQTGSVSGRVTKNGHGVLGAHIVAFDPVAGTLVGGFSLTAEGQFSISGLSPGPHVIRVEPLDDVGLDSFFDPTTNVDIQFLVAFFDRLVIVPRGGDSGAIEVTLVPK